MRTEYVKYSRSDLERMAKYNAYAELVGPLYIGNIGNQSIRWNDDGSLEVFTEHIPKEV